MVDALTEQVRGVLTPGVAAAGVDLEEVEVVRAGRRRLVRVSIDKDGGVTMDDVAAVTRTVSAALDASDVMGEQSYTLEVGSPGVSRPLTEVRHWRRNVGRLVRIVPADGTEPTTARIVAVSDTDPAEVTLSLDGREWRITQKDVERAVIQVELNRSEGKANDGH